METTNIINLAAEAMAADEAKPMSAEEKAEWETIIALYGNNEEDAE